jgi:DNA-binding NarL/FixJ family response regulator
MESVSVSAALHLSTGNRSAKLKAQARRASIPMVAHPAVIPSEDRPATIPMAGLPAPIPRAGLPAAIPALATRVVTRVTVAPDLVMAMSANLRVPASRAVPGVIHVGSRDRRVRGRGLVAVSKDEVARTCQLTREQLADPAGISTLVASRRVRVLVVEDHTLLGSAIARFLDAEADLSVVSVARTGAEAALVAARERPDVVLMDCRLPDMSGPAAAALIRTAVPAAVFVFHSAYDSEPILLDAIDSGAVAYLAKSATADDIVEAIRRAALGEILIPVGFFAQAVARQREGLGERHRHQELRLLFTPRELEVLNLLAAGLATIAIAEQLNIAAHTVEWHVRHVIEKLQVHSKLQAVIEAVRQGLVELGGSPIASGPIALDVHAV